MRSEKKHLESFAIVRVANDYFAIKATSVVEIMVMPKVTKVPKGARYLKGLFNHRGRILTLIDASSRLGLCKVEIGEKTPLVIIQHIEADKQLEFGVLVDEVVDMIEMDSSLILESTSLKVGYDKSFIEGAVKSNDRQVTILNIKNTFGIR